MRIVSLNIKDGMFEKKYNFSDKCIIYSKKNSCGKTTLIRMILYALGYNIPSTKKILFSKYEFELEIFTTEPIKLIRKNTIISLNHNDISDVFILPQQETDLHAKIFGISNKEVLLNLLGCFYLDQEKGWTLLNKGTVIGRVSFDVRELVRGIANVDCKSDVLELKNIQAQISKYNTMLEVANYKKSLGVENASYNKNITLAENIEASISDLEFKQKETRQNIHLYDEIIRDNNNFLNYILKSQLVIVVNGKEYLLTQDMIKDFNDITDFAKNKRKLLDLELKKINYELERLYNELEKNHLLVNTATILEQFNNNISKISINENAVLNTLVYLKNRKKDLESKIDERTKHSGETIQKLYNYIYQFAQELNFAEYIDNNSVFIFTSDLKGFSGAVLHKLVFIFKMGYIKILEDRYGIKLPIILDSPKGKEVDTQNIKSMMKIITKHFAGNQIIIASIDNDYELGEKQVISLGKSGVLGDLN